MGHTIDGGLEERIPGLPHGVGSAQPAGWGWGPHLSLLPELLTVNPLHLHSCVSLLVGGALQSHMAWYELREQAESSWSSYQKRLRTERAGVGEPWAGPAGLRHTDHRLSILILTQPQPVQHRAGEPCQTVGKPLPNGARIYVFHAAGIHNHINTLQQEGVFRQYGSLPSPSAHRPWVAGLTLTRTCKNSATLATWLAQAHFRASGTSSPTCKVANKEGVEKGQERTRRAWALFPGVEWGSLQRCQRGEGNCSGVSAPFPAHSCIPS